MLCDLLSLGSTADAQEWTRFRGPNGSGISDANTIPTKWTADDFNWRVKLPGVGHSSPVLWGQKIFVTSGDEEHGARTVLCLDSRDGRTLWLRNFTSTKDRKHQLNSFASSTPTVDADQVYVCWGTPQEFIVLALDHQGETRWRVDLGPYKSGHGFGSSPILHGDQVILGNDQEGESSIVALDRKTGAVRWRIPRKTKTAYSTPCVYQPSGRSAELIFTTWEHGIMGIDPRTGSTNWEIQVFDQKHIETSIGSPLVSGDLVLGTCGWLGVALHTVAVRPDASKTGQATEVYRVDKGAPLSTTPLVARGCLFLWGDNGIVTCVDALTGELAWRNRVGGTYYSSPIAVGAYVYCPSADGEMVVLAADKQYREIARNPLGEGSHSTPAVANGRMFVRTFTHIISLGGTTEASRRGRVE
jgi:outer membrane protein assembly factor BamB